MHTVRTHTKPHNRRLANPRLPHCFTIKVQREKAVWIYRESNYHALAHTMPESASMIHAREGPRGKLACGEIGIKQLYIFSQLTKQFYIILSTIKGFFIFPINISLYLFARSFCHIQTNLLLRHLQLIVIDKYF